MGAAFRANAPGNDGITAPVTTVSVTVPATAQVGDEALCIIQTNNTPTMSSAPAGWALLASGPQTDTIGNTWLYRKTIAAGEPGTAATWTLSATARPVATMTVLSGVTATGILVATPNIDTALVSNLTVPTLTGVPEGAAVVALFGRDRPANSGSPADVTVTAPYTQGASARAAAAQTTGTNPSTEVAYQIAGSAGSYGGQTLAITGGTSRGTTYLVALPATATGPTAPTVGAGVDATTTTGTAFTRTATENANGASITSRAWTIVSGPAGVGTTIGTAAALSWTPTTAGTYVLRYSATNSAGTGTDDVTVTVQAAPPTPRVQYGRNAAYSSGAGNLTSLAATLPSPATAGNLLTAAFTVDKDSGTFTVPSGWTLVPGFTGTTTGAQQVSLHAIYKIAAGGETTVTGAWPTAQDGAAAHIVEHSGVNTADPFGPTTVPAYDDTGRSSLTLDPGPAEAAGGCIVFLALDTEGTTVRFTPSAPGFTLVDSVSAIDFDPSATGGRPPLAFLEYNTALAPADDVPATTFTWQESDQAAGAAILLNAGTSTPPVVTPVLVHRAIGIPTGSSVQIGVRTTEATSVRAQLSTSATFASGIISSAAVTPNAQGDAILDVTGLAAGPYYLRIGMTVGGVETFSSITGPFKTAPAGQASYSFSFGACDDAADSATFAAIAARTTDDFFLHLGDWPHDTTVASYADGTGTSVANARAQYAKKLQAPNHAALYANRPMDLCWSDHDAFQNNGNAGTNPTAWANLNQAAREMLPLGPYPGTLGLYKTWAWGRVRYVKIDRRSFASAPSATDNSAKTCLGATQKQWLKDTIAAATEPLVIIVQADPWIDPASAGDDGWAGYSTERAELAAFFDTQRALGKRIGMLAGDMHALAADDGTNAAGLDFLFHAAPMENTASTKGGPYTVGPYPASGSAVVSQYGRVVVTDTGDQISAAFTGYSADNTQRVTLTKTFDLTAPAALPLYVGAAPLTAAHIGSTTLDALYVGSVQIYP